MNRGVAVLVLGLGLALSAFLGLYYLGTASSRAMAQESQPELAWLKREFQLSDAQFAKVVRLHEAYLPQCAERCRKIEEITERLKPLLAAPSGVTPQFEDLLVERARIRAQCEIEMMKHFVAVSRTMPAGQAERYLEWVAQATVLRGQAMEAGHHHHGAHAAGATP